LFVLPFEQALQSYFVALYIIFYALVIVYCSTTDLTKRGWLPKEARAFIKRLIYLRSNQWAIGGSLYYLLMRR